MRALLIVQSFAFAKSIQASAVATYTEPVKSALQRGEGRTNELENDNLHSNGCHLVVCTHHGSLEHSLVLPA
jgi:hypothetical protein